MNGENITSWIGSVFSRADWGNVPAWVGSILTAGSLMLGFYIILRDRKNSEKEQIRKLIVRYSDKPKDKSIPVLTNASELPFYDVSCTMHFATKGSICRKPSHWPVGPIERRRAAVVKHAIECGGRDSWPLDWPSTDYHDISNHTIQPGQTVTGFEFPRKSPSDYTRYMVVLAKDATGRQWALEVGTRTLFRSEYLRQN